MATPNPRPRLKRPRVADCAVCAAAPTATVLYREPRALLLARQHRLAGSTDVGLEDFADETMPRMGDPAWDAFWRLDPRPDGRLAPDGPVIDDVERLVDYLAEGIAVLVAPADSRIPDLHPDLVTVPLRGVEPGEVALVRRAGESSALVTAFAELAARLLGAGTPSPRRS